MKPYPLPNETDRNESQPEDGYWIYGSNCTLI
jgi:hypothetical protein